MTVSSVHRVCVMSADCHHIVIHMVVISTCETCLFRHQMSITVFTQTTQLALDILGSCIVVSSVLI